MPEVITSPSNPKVKRLLALQQKSSARREAGIFVVEGRRELQHCIDAGFAVDSVFYCPSRCGEVSANAKLFEVSEEVYAKIAMRESGPLPLTEPRVATVFRGSCRIPERI